MADTQAGTATFAAARQIEDEKMQPFVNIVGFYSTRRGRFAFVASAWRTPEANPGAE
jgi:hypothetical protein